MSNVQTHDIKIRPLDSKGVCEDVDIAVHNMLRLEQRRILIVDVSAKPCISTGWRINEREDVPLRDDDIVAQRFVYELEDTEQYSWISD